MSTNEEIQAQIQQLEKSLALLKQKVDTDKQQEEDVKNQDSTIRRRIKEKNEGKDTSEIEDVTKERSRGPVIVPRASEGSWFWRNRYEPPTLGAALLRGLLLIIVFLILHYLWQYFIFDPIFRPPPKINYDKILKDMCPDGAENCNFNLKKDWKEQIAKTLNGG
ncbi:hypothetical protein PROFUN_06470 [Planoprotostelium fungivorum]|uniref:Uncharacterized protein n=1 Tax=Planoprotostelium fungivorum TaxID=1890364 RepID=A0A2P6MR17_9EUKA|nr:hypothetical protein PROFUN_06470 [Planoprotostelium fungivorum]